MKKVFVVWLNMYWEATMVRPVVMIICSLLFLPDDIFCMSCNTGSRIHAS